MNGGAACTIPLLNSLLIENNRENPPSPNELLSKG